MLLLEHYNMLNHTDIYIKDNFSIEAIDLQNTIRNIQTKEQCEQTLNKINELLAFYKKEIQLLKIEATPYVNNMCELWGECINAETLDDDSPVHDALDAKIKTYKDIVKTYDKKIKIIKNKREELSMLSLQMVEICNKFDL